MKDQFFSTPDVQARCSRVVEKRIGIAVFSTERQAGKTADWNLC